MSLNLILGLSRRPRIVFLTAAVLAATTSVAAGQETPFDRCFADRTMRVDYQHAGRVGLEMICLEQVVNDGPWAGSRTRLLDDSGLGKYRFQVFDAARGELLYSRGFCSLYGEWETTPEAKVLNRSFHESLRFPWPKNPVRIVLGKRNTAQAFEAIAELTIDPASRGVNPAPLPPGWSTPCRAAGRVPRRSTSCWSATATPPRRLPSSTPTPSA